MKKFFSFSIVLILFFGFSNQSSAQVPSELLKVRHKIYNKSFSSAARDINAYIVENPDDPAGPLMLGITHDWNRTTNNRNLHAKSLAEYEKAKVLAEAALKKEPNSLYHKAMLGNAMMYIARKHLDAGKKFKAARILKKSTKIMQEVIGKDPSYSAAYFAIGMYNYFADNVPSGLKWLIKLLGFRGDKAKGIQFTKRAAATASLNQGDARYMIFYILSKKEKKYAEAKKYIANLARGYPRNQIFTFDLAEMQYRTKEYDQAKAGFDKFIGYCDKYKGRCTKKFQFLANYFMTVVHFKTADYQGGKPYFHRAKLLDEGKYKSFTTRLEKWAPKFN